MNKHSAIILTLPLLSATLFAQVNPGTDPDPAAKDFSGILTFLSSGWMEGREAGEKGSNITAPTIMHPEFPGCWKRLLSFCRT